MTHTALGSPGASPWHRRPDDLSRAMGARERDTKPRRLRRARRCPRSRRARSSLGPTTTFRVPRPARSQLSREIPMRAAPSAVRWRERGRGAVVVGPGWSGSPESRLGPGGRRRRRLVANSRPKMPRGARRDRSVIDPRRRPPTTPATLRSGRFRVQPGLDALAQGRGGHVTGAPRASARDDESGVGQAAQIVGGGGR